MEITINIYALARAIAKIFLFLLAEFLAYGFAKVAVFDEGAGLGAKIVGIIMILMSAIACVAIMWEG